MNKKGQIEIREMGITLVVAAILFTVSLLIFANISNSTESILDPLVITVGNESLTISVNDAGSNSSLLAQSRVIGSTLVLRNASDATDVLVENTDYRITLTDVSGVVGTRGNVTLLNEVHNGTALFADYQHNSQSAAQATTNNLETTVLDSFSLGVISLIVLAAVVILTVLFKLGT